MTLGSDIYTGQFRDSNKGNQPRITLSSKDTFLLKRSTKPLEKLQGFSWDPATREMFREQLLKLIKSCGCLFLLLNYRKENPETKNSGKPLPAKPRNDLFTPEPKRWAAEQHDVLPTTTSRTHAGFVTPRQSVSRFNVDDSQTGRTSTAGSRATGDPRGDAGKPHDNGRGDIPRVYLLPSATRGDRRATGPGGIRTRSARPAPSPLGRSLTQRQADAQAAQAQQEGASDDETEDIAPLSLPGDSMAGNAAPAQAGPGASPEVLNFLSTMQAKMDSSHEMFAEQLATTRKERDEDRATLAALRDQARKDGEARTATGCESWVAESQINFDIQELWVWYNEEDERTETEVENMWRLNFWQALTDALPAEMMARVDENDVRAVYARLIEFNQASAVEQVGALNNQLYAIKKGTQNMSQFLEGVYKIAARLQRLHAPPSVAHTKGLIRRALITDSRYKDAVSELDRNPS